jgi:hypothetical protein
MAETEEFASEQSDVCKRRLCGFAYKANHVATFKSFCLVYAFMYALIIKSWWICLLCVILYAQIVPPIGLEPILEGF